MPKKRISAGNVKQAVRQITPYLEDTRESAQMGIYFDGWGGLAASAVLRAIAQDPPPSLWKKFDKIIHINCSRWTGPRALQRAIVEELKLPQRIMAVFDRQDEEDDFSGLPQVPRAEIADIEREIYKMLRDIRCLVIFHNGSDNMVDLAKCGIPPNERFAPGYNKVLWTFRGRLRLNPGLKYKVKDEYEYRRGLFPPSWPVHPQWTSEEISRIKRDDPHLHLYKEHFPNADALLREEAREIAQYTGKLDVTPEIAAECCLYLLALNYRGGNIMDYNWAMHASNYWVCDGTIKGGQDNNEQAWDVAAALHQELRLENYSSNELPSFGGELHPPANHWIFKSNVANFTVPPESTSFFLAVKAGSDPPLASLPEDMFHQSNNLRVLKLCRCSFNFTSPPFHCCHSLRFLGLDSCKDQPREQEEKQQRPAMEFFQGLWVLDICYTDWELALSPKIIEQMATNIREVHLTRGKIWGCNLAWRRLRNLRKLRVIEPTYPWEVSDMDEFIDMGKLELLDLSRNRTMQVLPSLSGATGLKTLVLDGCVGLNHVGPEGLPPSLESFSLDTGAGGDQKEESKLSLISLSGCARLVNFRLRGSLSNLEELDLSSTSVKTLDLKHEVVKVPSLQQIILFGCEQLRSILWPEKGMPQLRVLFIDTRGEEVKKISPDSNKLQQEYCQAFVAMMDMRFVWSLVLRNGKQFCWITDRFNLNLCISRTSKDNGQRCNKNKIGPYSTGQIIGLPQQKPLIPNPSYYIYANVTIDHDDSNAHLQFQPLDRHLEIGEGISHTKNVKSVQGIKAVIFVMNKVESLHVHDNSSITTVIPECMMSVGEEQLGWHRLKQCQVERCPNLHIVFPSNYDTICFDELETFWAADLPMAHCIWSKGRIIKNEDNISFATLQSIHLYSCPRLVFVLPYPYLPNLETLHIVYCGDLRQVFPVEPEFLNRIVTGDRKGILGFPRLKHIHLRELPKLQQICEAKMSAPMLETIKLRGCWSLRRLPAVGGDSRPIVDFEKDWWGKLEWDGLHVGHDPSLFDLRPSQYYKKPLPRGSILR